MRELKFRAWDKKSKRMRVVWDIGWKGWDHPDESLNFVKVEGDGTHDLLPSEVELMQFTGLCDRNGREIYAFVGGHFVHMKNYGAAFICYCAFQLLLKLIQ